MDAADEVVERAVAAARGVELPEGPGAAVKGRVLAMGGGRRVRMRGRAWRWAVAALVVMTVGGMWGCVAGASAEAEAAGWHLRRWWSGCAR
jgi:hypothetical protein